MFNILYNTLYNIINDNVLAHNYTKNKKNIPKIDFTFKSKNFKYKI